MCDITRYDDKLFEILKESRTLPAFLNVIFGFLNRRTDFYVKATDPNSPVGLPEGLAERLVRDTFYKWQPKDLTIDGSVPEAVNEVAIEEEVISTDEETKIESFTSSDCYNGALYDNYSWSQTISEVDITVKIPKDVATKQLDVQILAQKISVSLKSSGEMLLEGELCQKCKHNDAIWSLDKSKLEIHLEKCYEMWWDCLVRDEPRLDVSKIDCSRPFEELSEEAQAKIQELTWNQERKRMGLPTSDELKMQETLKKAWGAEGSPFSGPFDPAAVNF